MHTHKAHAAHKCTYTRADGNAIYVCTYIHVHTCLMARMRMQVRAAVAQTGARAKFLGKMPVHVKLKKGDTLRDLLFVI